MAGLTTPLVLTRDGRKLGKVGLSLVVKQATWRSHHQGNSLVSQSAGNAIWLSAEKTPHLELYQYFVQTPTDDVVHAWMRWMTLLDEPQMAAALQSGSGAAQRLLARSVVSVSQGIIVR